MCGSYQLKLQYILKTMSCYDHVNSCYVLLWSLKIVLSYMVPLVPAVDPGAGHSAG